MGNAEFFKPIGNKLYEFRTRGGVRVFGFLDIDKMVICTSGYIKKKKKLAVLYGIGTCRNLETKIYGLQNLENSLTFGEDML